MYGFAEKLNKRLPVVYNKVDNSIKAVHSMEETLISSRLMTFLEQQGDIDEQTRRKLAAGSIDIVGDFFFEFAVPSTWYLCDINRIDQGELIFFLEVGHARSCLPAMHNNQPLQDQDKSKGTGYPLSPTL